MAYLKEFYTAKAYQAFRRLFLGGKYLGNDSLAVKILAEPLIKTLSLKKRMRLFKEDAWGTRLRFLLGWYEPETVQISKEHIKRGNTVLDVGAHIGYYTRIFSELVGKEGRVLAFEPHPATLNLLSFNVSSYKNVKLFPIALSDKKGKVDFFEFKGSGKNSFYDASVLKEIDPVGYAFKGKMKVKAAVLDELLEYLGVKTVDFMKIDVEGAEPKVLRGAKKTIKRSENMHILVELNTRSLSLAGFGPKAFLKQLKELGFRKILKLDEAGSEKSGYINLLCQKN